MKRINNSYLTNEIFVAMNEYATAIANTFGGKVTNNETVNSKGEIFTDADLSAYHKNSPYRVRVEFGADRHNAVEVTATSKLFYIAVGDTVAENIRDIFTGNADKGTKRFSDWELKTRCEYSLATFADVITGINAATETTASAEKKATANKTKSRVKKTTKKTA